MRKKLTLIIVTLSLIVSFGFTNVYANWIVGDPENWYFQLEAADSTATAWDITFHAVDDTYLESFGLEVQTTDPSVGFVSGVYDYDFIMTYGFGPMGGIVDRGDGQIGNIGGGIMGSGYDFEPGESMPIAKLTFDATADLDYDWINHPFFVVNVNGRNWDIGSLFETNNGITAPYADLYDKGLNPNPNTFGQTTVPVPAAVWLLGSGMLGLIGIRRRKNS